MLSCPRQVHSPRLLLVAALLGVLLLIALQYGTSRITVEPAQRDGRSNLLIAYNLAHSGTFALGTKNPRTTMYREPLPIFVLAAWMTAMGQGSVTSFDALNSGPGLPKLKSLNLVWMAGSLVLIFLITLALTGSEVVALLTALIAIPLITKGIDRFNTEIPAACLILASCYATLLLVKEPTLLRGFVAGVCLGAAILTKAIILYVFPFVAIGTVLLISMQVDSVRRALTIVAVLVAATAIIVTPWVARNAALLGEAQVANRGGPVLYKRMLLDGMTWEEYRGSFYVWAPNNVRSLLERIYGFTRDDIAAGGSLQRLNRSLKLPADLLAGKEARPDLATTYQYKMLAERARLAREFGNQQRGDREMMREALPWILTHPLQHLSLVAPLAWRGMWVRTIPTWLVPIMPASLLLAPLVGWATRRWDFVAFSLLPVSIFFAYTGVSHFIPRYSEPLVGAMLICLVTMTWWLVSSTPIKAVVEGLWNSARSLRRGSHSSSRRHEEESG